MRTAVNQNHHVSSDIHHRASFRNMFLRTLTMCLPSDLPAKSSPLMYAVGSTDNRMSVGMVEMVLS